MKRRGGNLGPGGGFALLLVVLVLGFLMMLAITLGLLVRQESQTEALGEADALARRHALVAMRAALAQLQRYAGRDERATAAAGDAVGLQGSRSWTGVWSTTEAGGAPLVWLVSETAEETQASVEVMSDAAEAGANSVRVPTQAIVVDGREMGACAWWTGDEGLKASLATAGGAAPLDENGTMLLEPRDPENAPWLGRVADLEQLAFLPTRGPASALERTALRARGSDWTACHRMVLSDPVRGGLKRDLSTQPGELGRAFSAWADPGTSMEDPARPDTPRISPDYGVAPLRHRYRFAPLIEDRGVAHGISPVISYFLLSFNVRTDPSGGGPSRPLEARARWLVSLWNPYTSALVPEDLFLEVAHLPDVTVVNDTNGAQAGPLALEHLWGTPLRIQLPWVPDGRPDRQSWFPGRVHTWAAKENLNKVEPAPANGFESVFYTRALTTASGQGVQRALAGSAWPPGVASHLVGAAAQLELRLYRRSATGEPELLRTFSSPAFDAFITPSAPLSGGTYQVTYVFNWSESTDTSGNPDAWLTTAGRDPREPVVGGEAFATASSGPHPELYPNYTAISFPDHLLDRALPASASSTTGQSYNEDVPVFELPRAPLQSIGDLQHLALPGVRPFAVGNPWGAAGGWNELFDRYCTSGWSAADLDDTETKLPALRIPGQVWIEGAPDEPAAQGSVLTAARDGWLASKILQEGALNVNSTNPAAWEAFLRSTRLNADGRFEYVPSTVATGTGPDDPGKTDFGDQAVFGRFRDSAAETYRADAGYAASSNAPPSAPNVASKANTHLYRRGLRALSAEETGALAECIAGLVRDRLTQDGPFRSLADFLGPEARWGGQSLLEAAIARTETGGGLKLNDRSRVPEFSSQTLLPSDLMSRLGNECTIRSDTFRIRAYGDARVKGSASITARAWIEAVVQRLPEWMDTTQSPEIPVSSLNATNRILGRRFQILSFRWLKASQI